MSFDAERLFGLLPTIYRLRDGEGPQSGQLRALVDVIAGQIAVLEEDLEQLYDDQFIETCAEWVAPYIGDLIGYRTLHGVQGRIGSPRAEVANTIAYRRRKGTASMLEQLARDVTGWDARVVEFFQSLAVTQYMNHLRPHNVAWVDMRGAAALETIGTPFDRATHVADVRRVARRRGRFNIPNVGVHVWRIRSYALEDVPAVKAQPGSADDRRFFFSPLGHDAPLYNQVVAEDTITHIAGRTNVPMPISRRELWDDPAVFCPTSIRIVCGGVVIPAAAISASILADFDGGWAYDAIDKVLIDPVLGRFVLPPALTVGGRPVDLSQPRVTFHYGFPADIGGGTYDRLDTLSDSVTPVVAVGEGESITDALAGLTGTGTIEVTTSATFDEPVSIVAGDGDRLELRGADGKRPLLMPGQDLVIELGDDSEVTLNGFLIAGATVRVASKSGAGRLRLRHCTLVPGLSLNVDGTPVSPDAPSLVIESENVTVHVDHSIVGSIRTTANASVRIASSIVDATDPSRVAYAALDGSGAGGTLEIVASTVVGKVHARVLSLVSNSILAARLSEGDSWLHPVHVERRQEGCIRFSYVPPGSFTPRQHRCQPASEDDHVRVQPQFVSERYGNPAYCQLSHRVPVEITTGADDESEMGAYHDLFAPQRQTNLEVRLEEYLRFGLEAGIFYAS